MRIKWYWLGLSVLLLFYAFDTLVFGLLEPVFNPGIRTLTDRVIRAFIAMAFAGLIISYTSKLK